MATTINLILLKRFPQYKLESGIKIFNYKFDINRFVDVMIYQLKLNFLQELSKHLDKLFDNFDNYKYILYNSILDSDSVESKSYKYKEAMCSSYSRFLPYTAQSGRLMYLDLYAFFNDLLRNDSFFSVSSYFKF